MIDVARIEYVLPTSRSFAGMKGVLFQPFDLGKWFVLGFTAWLAALADGGGSSGGSGNSGGMNGGGGDPQLQEVFRDIGAWIEENMALVIGIGIAIVLVVVVVGIVLLWISSRGKFMFLDNVVHNRALVKDPWARFKTLGNSLFLWRLVFALVVTAVILLIVGTTGFAVFAARHDPQGFIVPLVIGGLALVAVLIPIAYVGMLLEDFVIPVMYREALTTNAAWRRFLSLHSGAFGQFILYALWKFLLGLGTAICILAVGVGTCCIGFIIMAIPYLGAVLLLPVSVFFRFLGPEFLRQFGSEWDILAPAPSV